MNLLDFYNAEPGDLIQHAEWEGIRSFESLKYTCSHGISPGIFTIVTAPQDEFDQQPARAGDLLLTDGYRSIIFRDCVADHIDGSKGPDGTTYTILLKDRRWRWQGPFGGFGGIDGWYNQTDPRGKLVPWSIRSPEELAKICLQAMGEFNYVIALPPGLRKADGLFLDRYLRLGDSFPQTTTNPEFRWTRKPPAQALAEVADKFGCRVIYQPTNNRILVVPLGYGESQLPDYPYDLIVPSLDAPVRPKAIGVYGPAARIQARFAAEPVGDEWDDSVLPINLLSYAPRDFAGQVQITTINWNLPAVNPCYGLQCFLTWGNNTAIIGDTTDPATIAQRWGRMMANATGNAAAVADMTFSSAGNVFKITGKRQGMEFNVAVIPTYFGAPPEPDGLSTSYTTKLVQKASDGGNTWGSCPPPHFRAVRPTDRLSYMEAIAKAQGSVWKKYRILNIDPDTRKSPMMLPMLGAVARMTQLVFQQAKVEQVEPAPRIAGGVDKDNPLRFLDPGGIMPEFYNGRSRDQKATVRGSIDNRIGRVFWFALDKNNGNTDPSDRVFTSFTVGMSATGDQLITFGDFVNKRNPAGINAAFIEPPDLILETAVVFMDAETNTPYRYFKTLDLPGGTAPIEWHEHEDLQIGIVGEYPGYTDTRPNRLAGWHYGVGDKAHCDTAADFYLQHHAKKYEIVIGEARNYIGTIPINPTGTIHQITWSLGPGNSTLVSLGSEHSPYVPSAPERRRKELLPPDRAAVAANMHERVTSNGWFGPASSATK